MNAAPRMRPHRVQAAACNAVLSEALDAARAADLLAASGINRLPALLPEGPRDLAALAAELQPFVTLYRLLLATIDQPAALAIMRRVIIDAGRVSHAADAGGPDMHDGSRPLVLTSPPPPGFAATPDELAAGFEQAMRFFACSGELLAYNHELVHFRVTDCNWCRAMQAAGAPELITFFCETDERFMDDHPTHRLERATAIGLGDGCCDFRFVPRTSETKR